MNQLEGLSCQYCGGVGMEKGDWVHGVCVWGGGGGD